MPNEKLGTLGSLIYPPNAGMFGSKSVASGFAPTMPVLAERMCSVYSAVSGRTLAVVMNMQVWSATISAEVLVGRWVPRNFR